MPPRWRLAGMLTVPRLLSEFMVREMSAADWGEISIAAICWLRNWARNPAAAVRPSGVKATPTVNNRAAAIPLAATRQPLGMRDRNVGVGLASGGDAGDSAAAGAATGSRWRQASRSRASVTSAVVGRGAALTRRMASP